jgi:hypothetical protein
VCVCDHDLCACVCDLTFHSPRLQVVFVIRGGRAPIFSLWMLACQGWKTLIEGCEELMMIESVCTMTMFECRCVCTCVCVCVCVCVWRCGGVCVEVAQPGSTVSHPHRSVDTTVVGEEARSGPSRSLSITLLACHSVVYPDNPWAGMALLKMYCTVPSCTKMVQHAL